MEIKRKNFVFIIIFSYYRKKGKNQNQEKVDGYILEGSFHQQGRNQGKYLIEKRTYKTFL